MGRDEAAYGHAFRKVRLEVANRYDWTCSWCGQPIDPDAKYPDPGSLAIDHVVPVVEAGPEVPPIEGMRPQHLRCSSSSGSHVSQPLAQRSTTTALRTRKWPNWTRFLVPE